MTEEITYKKFLSMYSKQHTVSYAQAMKDCAGPNGLWAKYKAEHNIQPKPRVRKPKPSVEKTTDHPAEVDVAPASKKTTKKKAPAKKAPRRKVVKVQAPPRGKKMVVSYVTDSESEEDNVEIVDPNPQTESEEEQEE